MATSVSHDAMANAIRFLALDAVEKAKSGHPGLPMGSRRCRHRALARRPEVRRVRPPLARSRPVRPVRPATAACCSIALLYLTGVGGAKGLGIEDIKQFRQVGSRTPGHPEYWCAPGVETTTGPLGQGISTAVGMAIAERMLAARFPGIVDHHTYVLASDGDLMEGVSQEAIGIAGHLKLKKLIVFWDNNGISIDGQVPVLADNIDQVARFQSAGWNSTHIDGHDPKAILDAIHAAQNSDRPTMIACKTTIGFGLPTHAGTNKAHSDAQGAAEVAGARKNLNWPYEPFVIPDDILAPGARRGRAARRSAKNGTAPSRRSTPKRAANSSGGCAAICRKTSIRSSTPIRRSLPTKSRRLATRKAGQAALDVIGAAVPELITSSADLTPSNNTKFAGEKEITADDFSGRYIHWGIREHGMIAACNGIALHGGFIPSGASFFCFTDYCRPSLRLAALMEIRVVHVFTHDSIGLGEDGPTHQPVEHLASLRAMPNFYVWRPADSVETVECWQAALEREHSPSILALTRQGLPAVRTTHVAENLCARGGYEISPASGEAQVSIFASGSEVSLAVAAQAQLKEKGVAARVVSLPCFPVFFEQPEDYRRSVIGSAKVKVGVEAAVQVRMGRDHRRWAVHRHEELRRKRAL